MNRNENLLPAVRPAAAAYPTSLTRKEKFLRALRTLYYHFTYSRTKYARVQLELLMQKGYTRLVEAERDQIKIWYERAETLLVTRDWHTQNIEDIIRCEWGAQIYVSTFPSTELIVAIKPAPPSYASIRVYSSAMGPASLAHATLRTTGKCFKLNCLSIVSKFQEDFIERAMIVAAIAHAKSLGAEGLTGAALGSTINLYKLSVTFESLGFKTWGDRRVLRFFKKFKSVADIMEVQLEVAY